MASETGEQTLTQGKIDSLEKQIAGEVTAAQEVLENIPGQPTKNDVSAATIGRLMGLATVTEIQLIEGKIDALGTKLLALTQKFEKMLAWTNRAPTGADLERIDVQIGTLRTLIRDTMAGVAGEAMSQKGAAESGNAKKTALKIMTNSAAKNETAAASPESAENKQE